LWDGSLAARIDSESEAAVQPGSQARKPTHALLPHRLLQPEDHPDWVKSPCSVTTAVATPCKNPSEKTEIQEVEEHEKCIAMVEEVAEKEAAEAKEAERQAEIRRKDAHDNAMKAREGEKNAVDTRDKAARDAIIAAENLQLVQDAEKKSVVAKDSIDLATVLSQHARYEQAQSHKEARERQEMISKANVAAAAAAAKMRLADISKETMIDVSLQNRSAHARAKEAMVGALDAKAVVDKMYQQRALAANRKSEMADKKAKQMHAESEVAKNAARIAADFLNPDVPSQPAAGSRYAPLEASWGRGPTILERLLHPAKVAKARVEGLR